MKKSYLALSVFGLSIVLVGPAVASHYSTAAFEKKVSENRNIKKYSSLGCSYSWSPVCSIQDAIITPSDTFQMRGMHPDTEMSVKEISISNVYDYKNLNSNGLLLKNTELHSVLTFDDIKVGGESLVWSSDFENSLIATGVNSEFVNTFLKNEFDGPLSVSVSVDSVNTEGSIFNEIKVSTDHKAFSTELKTGLSVVLDDSGENMKDGLNSVVINNLAIRTDIKEKLIPTGFWELYKVTLAQKLKEGKSRAIAVNRSVGAEGVEPISYDAFVKFLSENAQREIDSGQFARISFPHKDELVMKFKKIIAGEESFAEVDATNVNGLNLQEMTQNIIMSMAGGNSNKMMSALQIKIK